MPNWSIKMSWLDEAIPMVRILINDWDEQPQFSDARLTDALIASAKLVAWQFGFTSYAISTSNLSVTPDPVDNKDETFLNLSVLKAACLVDHGQYRAKAALEGLKVSCGPGSLSVGGHLAGFKTILELGPCSTYEELRNQYLYGNVNVVKGIFGPFINNKFDPYSLINSEYGDRYR
jgi:hypothetical protein